MLRKLAVPHNDEAGPTVVGSRRLLRQLVHHAVAKVERTTLGERATLRERATVASAAVMEMTRGS